VKLIDQGVEDGDLKPLDNAEQVALTIIALIEGGIMIRKATGKSSYWKAIIRSVEQIIIDLK
jgi:TetR/AcrR family transcriptional regulator, transcriptional repressor for nem operon